jgi:hypothetical protein
MLKFFRNLFGKNDKREIVNGLPVDVILTLIPTDFIGNEYTNSRDCALSRACKRVFDTTNLIFVGPFTVDFYDEDEITRIKSYKIIGDYYPDDFEKDRIASGLNPEWKKEVKLSLDQLK